MTLEDARNLALALPETTEEDHHGMPSFRVRGKIFATVPNHHLVRIMVDEAEIQAVVAEHPQVCQPMFWGKRLACVVVDLDATTRSLLRELLTEAWLRKAPKRLAQTLPRA